MCLKSRACAPSVNFREAFVVFAPPRCAGLSECFPESQGSNSLQAHESFHTVSENVTIHNGDAVSDCWSACGRNALEDAGSANLS